MPQHIRCIEFTSQNHFSKIQIALTFTIEYQQAFQRVFLQISVHNLDSMNRVMSRLIRNLFALYFPHINQFYCQQPTRNKVMSAVLKNTQQKCHGKIPI